MSRLLSRFATATATNPLLAHGPRTHRTGVELPASASAPVRSRRRPLDVDAPKVHLGHAGRAA